MPHRAVVAAAALAAAVFALGVGCADIVSETPSLTCDQGTVSPDGWLLTIGTGPRYDVPPSTENLWTIDFKYSRHIPMDVRRIALSACPGAMSLDLLTSATDLPSDTLVVGFSTPDWSRWSPIAVGGSNGIDWTLPDSVALHVRHHAQLEVRAHYLNLAGAPVSGDRVGVVTTFEPMETGEPKYYLSSMLIEDTTFALAPQAVQTVTKTVTLPHDVTLLALAGEYHRYGTRLTVEAASAPGGPWTTVVEWTGPAPQFTTLPAPVRIPAGGQIRITGAYDNTSAQTVLSGPRWDGDEALRLFVFHTAAPVPAAAEALIFQ